MASYTWPTILSTCYILCQQLAGVPQTMVEVYHGKLHKATNTVYLLSFAASVNRCPPGHGKPLLKQENQVEIGHHQQQKASILPTCCSLWLQLAGVPQAMASLSSSRESG